MKGFILKASYRYGITLKVTDGFRTVAEQDDLYAQGRTKPGNRVTNAKGGDSNHNFGLAIDVVPMVANGKGKLVPDWESTNFPLIGRIGQSVGLEWGGGWTKLVDMPHFQNLKGQNLKELKKLEKDANGLPIIK